MVAGSGGAGCTRRQATRAKMIRPSVIPIDLCRLYISALNGPAPLGRLIIHTPSPIIPSTASPTIQWSAMAVRVYGCSVAGSERSKSRTSGPSESEPVPAGEDIPDESAFLKLAAVYRGTRQSASGRSALQLPPSSLAPCIRHETLETRDFVLLFSFRSLC